MDKDKLKENAQVLFNKINKFLKLSETELKKEWKEVLKAKYKKESISECSISELKEFNNTLSDILHKLNNHKISVNSVLTSLKEQIIELPGNMSITCFGDDMYNHLKTVLHNYIDNNDFSGYEKDLFELMDLRKTQYILSLKENSKDAITLKTKVSSEIAAKERELGISMGQRQSDLKEDPFKEWNEAICRAREYAKEHLGQYTWRCSSCGQMNLNNVPHFAFDSIVKNAVFNKEIFELIRDGRLTVSEAARILRTSCVGILAIAWERDFDLNIKYDLNVPSTLLPYVSKEEIEELEKIKKEFGIESFDEIKTIEQRFEKISTVDGNEIATIVDETKEEGEEIEDLD